MGSKSKSNQSSSSQNVSNNQGVSSGVNMNYGTNQSGNSSSGSSVNSSNQSVWGGQQDALENVYDSAGSQYGQAIDSINGLQPQVQDQVSGAFNQAQGGYGNQLGGGFASGLQGQVGPNAYTDALAGDMMSDAAQIKQQNLGGLDARAAAAGMSGSSGYRNQVNQMADNVDEQTMQGLNQLRFNSQNQGIQNQMNLAGMQDRNQQAGLANMGAMQQGAMNQFNPAMAGLNATGAYGQIIGGPTVLGSSSGSSTNSSNGFSNGMNVGMGVNGSTNIGSSFGSSTGQGSSNSMTVDPKTGAAVIGALGGSDARLKENVKHVEQIDGINMYTWDWKDPAMSWPMNYGVIAQEVAETHPEAVVTGDHGYMMVDYSKLGRAGEVALSRMEG
ncbi:hypothetical protein [uncultured Mediterranean phage uvMED]|nr:hypothetical protein [uncultured Mediterranean phage uvMED]